MSITQTSLPTRLWRSARLLAHLLHGVAVAALIVPRLDPAAREARIKQWCATVLSILHVRVVLRGHAPAAGTADALFVANHISWIDIWVLKQLHPMRFVAKAEIRDWSVIGWLAEKAGTLFIQRHKRQETGRMMNSVEEALRAGDCLCFFPEGTTTDGTELKPFKSSLFQAAVNAGATVWPVALYYPHPDGGANTAIAYCGEITMLQSLIAVLKQQEIIVTLDFAEPISAQGQERRHLCSKARQAIASRLNLPSRKAPETHAGLRAATQ